ncbi:arginase [Catalinimonas alkaloidigena]|uniref:Arginase n=1 Tax=Catalinimonas alkaloidigena TaxID=1075417 RepID=A0A1G9KKI1_9BACT|nr:arginase family protein [Catalinimonas alkaloidigena]SDL49913.1 arginase [Catalinimonas alkaloidigena]
MKPLHVLEFPTNLGLKEPAPGVEPGVRKLPDGLRRWGLYARLSPVEIERLSPPPYTMHLDPDSGVRNAEAIATYAEAQADLLRKVLELPRFPLVIGGDCSVLLGNALALKTKGRYALFFVDGHTDYMSTELSSTGGAAGMDLALATGWGHPKLTNLRNQKPYFPESSVWAVGNREYHPQYVATIRQSAITYLDLATLRQEGPAACAQRFLRWFAQEGFDGFWLHLDLDVLDDAVMPAVDSRAPDGLRYDELHALLAPLVHHPQATGLEITILDPDLDPTGQYTRRFIDAFSALMQASPSEAT